MKTRPRFLPLSFPPLSVLPLLATLMLAGCAGSLDPGPPNPQGANPMLPAPQRSLLPTVNIARAVGWAADGLPRTANGLQVQALARDLNHPRWLLVLPNGDVLVAESNAPARPDDGAGLRGWIMKQVMALAGAGVPSADRITLLRDADGDGVAETRSVFIAGLHSPFGMALVGQQLYVANTDAVLRFAYTPGATRLAGPGEWVADLPAGPINHHWTKALLASTDGQRLMPASAPTAMSARTAWTPRPAARQSSRSTLPAAPCGPLPAACATPMAWPGSPPAAGSGRWSTSATNWATTWCPTT